jgi:cobalamin biosynthesis Mg chelatase CobN
VLALLALACFPVLAQAESSGAQYETEIPTVTGHTTPPKNTGGGVSAHASNGPSSGNSTGSGSGSSSGGASGTNPSTGGGSGSGQPSSGNGATGGNQVAAQGNGNGAQSGTQVATKTPAEDSSSSPLVPILIAIAVLAAISIGAVVLRQRRQRRSPGGQVSPKAS